MVKYSSKIQDTQNCSFGLSQTQLKPHYYNPIPERLLPKYEEYLTNRLNYNNRVKFPRKTIKSVYKVIVVSGKQYIAVSILVVIGVLFFYFDINSNLEAEYVSKIIDINTCTYNYTLNECGIEPIRPAVVEYCAELEKCISLSARQSMSYTKVWARTISGIIEEFISNLSINSLAILASLIIFKQPIISLLLLFLKHKTTKPRLSLN